MKDSNKQELIESVSTERLLELLDMVKDEIADARKGNATTEARKLAIDTIDQVLYNKVKAVINNESNDKPKQYFSEMI